MKLVKPALLAGTALVFAACGSDKEPADPVAEERPAAPEVAKPATPPTPGPKFVKIAPDQVDEAGRKAAEDFARSYEESRKAGVFEPLGDEATAEMRAALTPEKQQQGQQSITANIGEFQSLEYVEAWRRVAGTQSTIYRLRGKFTKGEPEIRVVHDTAGKVSGFWVRPWRDSLEPPRPERVISERVDGTRQDAAMAFALGYLESRKAGKFAPLGDEVTAEMRETLTPERQQQAYESITAQVGEFQSLDYVEAQRLPDDPGTMIYRFRGTFTKDRPEVRVVHDAAGKVSGFWIKPWSDELR
jgi:hypothetical protein